MLTDVHILQGALESRMTPDREEEIVAVRRDIRRRAIQAIQRIVDARLRGERDDVAISELAALSRQEVELTKPFFEAA